jgi:hypothetical protein
MKPVSAIAAALLSIVALAHLYRLIRPFEIMVAGSAIPQWASAVGLVVAGGIALGLWREGRR